MTANLEAQYEHLIDEQMVWVDDGVMAQVLTAGEGPPLVLLHGDGDSAVTWQWVMPTLARTHRVYAVSFPGHGDSSKPLVDYSPQYLSEFTVRLLDELRIEQCAIIGNSIGGLAAMHIGLDHPDRLSTLVLVDTAGIGRAVNPLLAMESLPWMGEMGIAMSRGPAGPFIRSISRVSQLFWRPDRAPMAWLAEQRRGARVPGFLDASVAAKRAVLGPWGQHAVIFDELHRLTMPTLVVWGAYDRVIPVMHAHRAMTRLPNAELAIIPSCGHVAHVERPDEFLEAVVPFLQAHPPEAAAAAPSFQEAPDPVTA